DGNELHVAAAVIPQKAVNLERRVRVGAVHGGQRIEVDLVTPQSFDAAHHAIKSGLAAFVHAVGIVQFARTVNGNAYQELIFKEEFRPRVVQQDAVGLEGVGNLLAVGVF